MRKRIFSIALAALAVLTVTTTASAAKPEGSCDNNTECQAPGKKKCKKHKQERRERCQGADSAMYNPFEGLNLTAEQTEAIKAIPTPREVMKAAKKQQGDSNTGFRTMMLDVRKNYLAQVKQVLTPEQYTQFLENFYVKQMPMGKKDKKAGHGPKGKKNKQKRGHGPKQQQDASQN